MFADYPHTGPCDGRKECPTCGKYVYAVIHSCKRIPVTDAARARAGLSITTVEITHPQGFGDHEFEYEPGNDLFRCTRCRRYEAVLRDHTTGHIQPCTGPTTGEDHVAGPEFTCPGGRTGPLPPISPECYPPDAAPLPTTREDTTDAR